MEAHHYGLTVSELATARRFYEDTLGFPVLHTAHLSGAGFSDLVGVPDAAADVVFLDAGGLVLELFEFHDPGEPPAESPSSTDRVGAHHLAFVVDDVDAWYDRLADDVAFHTEPVAGGTGIRAAYLQDPDGNVVELVSRELEALLENSGSVGDER